MSNANNSNSLPPIAIIGMAGRFPGANNTGEFWRNLCNGIESISTFADSELELPEDGRALLDDPRYVKRQAILDGVELFDAAFFGYTAREAELSDPQQRFFLQCAYEALESAGYDPERFEGSIGVFGGSGFNYYLIANLLSNRELLDSIGFFQTAIRNGADHLATTVAYKLNLKGPAVTVQTACSTSLVAVHLACQSLISFECDMALAGGVSILPQKAGYLYREGGILSPDGHCRAFDAAAQGTVPGNGAAVIVLKRLEDAVRDHDPIEAVILGSAIGNDGSVKAGYAAPSVEGQARVIAEAQMVAGVEPETITCIEAHGTGTTLGDPIEIAALNQVFQQHTNQRGYCAIGSLKTNIGHLDAAAGVAGLIKAALSLKHKMLPPSLHFERSNPEINFPESPFFVNTKLRPWNVPGPRRAGVSSFGIGGTNAHIILEEPPAATSGKETRRHQLLLLSAKTTSALETAAANLADFLETDKSDLSLADVAYTLQVGRRGFNHRRAVVCRDHDDAVLALKSSHSSQTISGLYDSKDRSIIFMFPGQGAQYPEMGKGLYENEPLFRQELENCARILGPHLGFDLLQRLYPEKANHDADAAAALMQTAVAQPALFAIEYSLARLWMQWGIQPEAMIGHSIGEYVAACLAGVLTLEDALRLVAVRGRLMQSQPAGAMLSVQKPEKELSRRLLPGLDLAAINGPESCVVAGDFQAVEEFEQQLAKAGISSRRLSTSHAFHSAMMEPILGEFRDVCSQISFHALRIPFISNLSGAWITSEQATNPEYWVRHLRETVRFGDGLQELLQNQNTILLEVGPGQTLGTLARRHPHRAPQQPVLNSLRHHEDSTADDAFLLATLGKLWIAGARVDWTGFYQHERRKRVPLPLYPFEPQRYWIEPKKEPKQPAGSLEKKQEIAEWFYVPSWKRVPVIKNDSALTRQTWLILLDSYGCGLQLVEQLQHHGAKVFTVQQGQEFSFNDKAFTVRPEVEEDYQRMFKSLHESGRVPEKVVHLWNLVDPAGDISGAHDDVDLSFWNPLLLARAIGAWDNPSPATQPHPDAKENQDRAQPSSAVTGESSPAEGKNTELLFVSNHLYDVTGDKVVRPERSILLGPCRVVPQEYPGISCRHIDLDVLPGQKDDPVFWSHFVADCVFEAEEKIIAYRRGHRWVQTFEPLSLRSAKGTSALRDQGTYLITGGLGGIGLVLAEQLARSVHARLVLIARSSFPSRDLWERWLETHKQDDSVSIKIRKLLSFEQMGAEVLVLSADVSNQSELNAAINNARKHFDSIHGVLHCAGVAGGGVIQLKSREAALAVLAPKVKGTMLLASTFQGTPLDFFMVCSSGASILGGFGQVDYCAASAFIDVFAQYCRTAATVPMTSINWDAWQEVGMLVDKAAEYAAARETAHSLLGRHEVESSGRAVFTSVMSADSHWVLNEHRILGQAVMPGVAYLEMARAAAETQGINQVEITDAFFIEPLHFQQEEQREVRITLEGGPESYLVKIASRRRGENSAWREHAIATVASLKSTPITHQPDKIAQRCNQPVTPEDDWVDETMGPRWHVYRTVMVGATELLAWLELPEEFVPELQQLKLYPTLLDRAAALGKRLLVRGGAYVPMIYSRLRIHGPLEKRILVHIRLRPQPENQQETITFDIVLMNEQGRELVAAEEFSEKKISSALPSRVFGDHPHQQSNKDSFVTENGRHSNGVVASVYAARLEHGITTSEGQEAFQYILGATELPQIIVFTKDLQTSIVEARNNSDLKALVEQAAGPLPTHILHPRPNMETAFTAPRSEFEGKIAEAWGRVLGVAEVGVHDNYFDLGGDSVQAIQIIAQMNQQGFHLTPQQLFQHQTVSELAQVATGVQRVSQPPAEVISVSSSPEFPLSGLNEQELEELEKFLEETDKSQL